MDMYTYHIHAVFLQGTIQIIIKMNFEQPAHLPTTLASPIYQQWVP